jgi:hypothetical protein
MEDPYGVETVVKMISVDVPEPVIGAPLKVAVAPAGKPLAAKETLPVKAPMALTATLNAAFAPPFTICEDGVTATEKSAPPGPFPPPLAQLHSAAAMSKHNGK